MRAAATAGALYLVAPRRTQDLKKHFFVTNNYLRLALTLS